MGQGDFNWDQHDQAMSRLFAKRAREGRRRRQKWLVETAKRISERHKIPDREAQQALLNELRGMPTEILSGTNFDPDNWHIPRDLTPWKEARAQLIKLAEDLGSATEILKRHDRVVFDALSHAAANLPFREVPDFVKATFEFEHVAREAASLRGKSGNRPHPVWMREATDRCQSFWRTHMRSNPAGYFNAEKKPARGQRIVNRTTAPGNAFSRWFCDVMKAVAGLTPSQCDTLLRQQ